jgi:hypothetical protein
MTLSPILGHEGERDTEAVSDLPRARNCKRFETIAGAEGAKLARSRESEGDGDDVKMMRQRARRQERNDRA